MSRVSRVVPRTPPKPPRLLLAPAEGLGRAEPGEGHVRAHSAACNRLHHTRREEGERQMEAQVSRRQAFPLGKGGEVSFAVSRQSLSKETRACDRPQQNLPRVGRDRSLACGACDLPHHRHSSGPRDRPHFTWALRTRGFLASFTRQVTAGWPPPDLNPVLLKRDPLHKAIHQLAVAHLVSGRNGPELGQDPLLEV